MPEPLRLLMFSKDPTLFAEGPAQGDARRRHIRYAQALACARPGSEIRIVTHTAAASGHRFDAPADGLRLYGTASPHRLTYVADAARVARSILQDGWRPDAICPQTPWEEGQLGVRLAKRTGARFLPQLHFDLFSAAWRAERVYYPLLGRIAEGVLRQATRIRVVSEPLREAVTAKLGIAMDRVDVIPVSVSLTTAEPGETAKAALDPRLAGRPVVLFVGRMAPPKNLPLWLDVAEDVLAEAPEARFVLVGDGELEGEVRRRVEAKGLSDQILVLGPMAYEALPEAYAAADLLLLTSDNEGFGRVLLEAAEAGVPAVATRCSGPMDVIADGVSGYLLDLGDRAGLGEAVLRLLRDPVLRARMGAAARASASQDFGRESLTQRLIEHWTAP